MRSAVLFAAMVVPVFGIWLKVSEGNLQAFDRAASIAYIEAHLDQNGLKQSLTSDISVSGQTSGVVFNRDGCAGALIVVPLPPTAQSFEQVVAGLDREVAATGFVYRGRSFANYPGLQRLADRAGYALRLSDVGSQVWQSTIFAFKELGPCQIIQDVDWRHGSTSEII